MQFDGSIVKNMPNPAPLYAFYLYTVMSMQINETAHTRFNDLPLVRPRQ